MFLSFFHRVPGLERSRPLGPDQIKSAAVSREKISILVLGLRQLHAHAREDLFFTVVFYGPAILGCKTAQFGETLREALCSGLALKNRLRNITKNCAKSS